MMLRSLRRHILDDAAWTCGELDMRQEQMRADITTSLIERLEP